MTFCPKCGAERKAGSKFCHNCGYDFSQLDSSRKSADVGADSSFRPNDGVQSNQNSHGFLKILGYIFAILIPIIGIVIGIYLWMSGNQEDHKHGKYIIILAVAIQLFSFASVLFS